MHIPLKLLVTLFSTLSMAQGAMYTSPAGTDNGSGTLNEPVSLSSAISRIGSGDTIFVLGGVYVFSSQVTIGRTNHGTAQSRKCLFAFAGEQPIFDFSTQPYTTANNQRGLQIDGSFWHIRGLDIKGSADNGMYISGNNNIIDRCSVHGNHDTGLQLGRYASSALRAEWPAENLILNCDSYDNYDAPPGGGENADGFACKLTTGPGNTFRGCISHNNIDDGWDLYTKGDTGPIDAVILDQCIAYNNGILTDATQSTSGDRNGFKLGGEDIAVAHTVTRCVAFGNGKNGFTWNSNPGAILMVNNLAFDNVQRRVFELISVFPFN